MSDLERVKISEETGTEARHVSLARRDDGSIRMDAVDTGPAVEKVWGSDDYEFWVTVPSQSVTRLAFVLLKEKFTGRSDAVTEFREFCKARGIAHSFNSWV
jgi:hypothetical protein